MEHHNNFGSTSRRMELATPPTESPTTQSPNFAGANIRGGYDHDPGADPEPPPSPYSIITPSAPYGSSTSYAGSYGTRLPSADSNAPTPNAPVHHDRRDSSGDTTFSSTQHHQHPTAPGSGANIAQHTELCYDQRYHPMDELNRPAQAAKVKARYYGDDSSGSAAIYENSNNQHGNASSSYYDTLKMLHGKVQGNTATFTDYRDLEQMGGLTAGTTRKVFPSYFPSEEPSSDAVTSSITGSGMQYTNNGLLANTKFNTTEPPHIFTQTPQTRRPTNLIPNSQTETKDSEHHFPPQQPQVEPQSQTISTPIQPHSHNGAYHSPYHPLQYQSQYSNSTLHYNSPYTTNGLYNPLYGHSQPHHSPPPPVQPYSEEPTDRRRLPLQGPTPRDTQPCLARDVGDGSTDPSNLQAAASTVQTTGSMEPLDKESRRRQKGFEEKAAAKKEKARNRQPRKDKGVPRARAPKRPQSHEQIQPPWITVPQAASMTFATTSGEGGTTMRQCDQSVVEQIDWDNSEQTVVADYRDYKWSVKLYKVDVQKTGCQKACYWLEDQLSDRNLHTPYKWFAHTTEGFLSGGDDLLSIVVLHNATMPFETDRHLPTTTFGYYEALGDSDIINWKTVCPGLRSKLQKYVEDGSLIEVEKWTFDDKDAKRRRFHRAYWKAANRIPLQCLLNRARPQRPVTQQADVLGINRTQQEGELPADMDIDTEPDMEDIIEDLEPSNDGIDISAEDSAAVWKQILQAEQTYGADMDTVLGSSDWN